MLSKVLWSLELEDNVPAAIPVPHGYFFMITGIHAVDLETPKIIVDAVVQVIRLDKLGEDDHVAESDVIDATLAVLFPRVSPALKVEIPFSKFNIASVRASGGRVLLTGFYETADGLTCLTDCKECE
jgi:hypothetical protein